MQVDKGLARLDEYKESFYPQEVHALREILTAMKDDDGFENVTVNTLNSLQDQINGLKSAVGVEKKRWREDIERRIGTLESWIRIENERNINNYDNAASPAKQAEPFDPYDYSDEADPQSDGEQPAKQAEQYSVCNYCQNECKATHPRKKCDLYVDVRQSAKVEQTITISRDVAEEWLNAKSWEAGYSKVVADMIIELRKALNRKDGK